MFWVMDMALTADIDFPALTVYHFPCLPYCLKLSSSLFPAFRPLGVLRFHSHPQLLVPEQQFASGFIELQPVNLRVVAYGSQIVASSQVH